MTHFVEMDVGNGVSVLVETDDATEMPNGASQDCAVRGRRPQEQWTRTQKSLEHVLEGLGPTIRAVFAELTALSTAPGQIEVEFAVKVSAEAQLIIARAVGDANFRVKLNWTREAPAGAIQPTE